MSRSRILPSFSGFFEHFWLTGGTIERQISVKRSDRCSEMGLNGFRSLAIIRLTTAGPDG
jgi:hypothetical protein